MRNIHKIVILIVGIATSSNASGYRIPEQSLRGVALGAANVAAVDGSDASYYNPANMVFMSEPRHELELGFTYIQLPSMKFKDATNSSQDGKTKVEHFVAPYMHIVIPDFYENWRFGFSLVAPGGLAKRWDTPFQKATAKKFSLKIIEANPTAAYKINDYLAIGFGARMVYTSGVVASYANTQYGEVSRKMSGDSFDFGYNLAISARPIEGLALAATYRSNVDLTVSGDANLVAGGTSYSGSAKVDIVLPAVLNLAVAYTHKSTTVEFVYEKTYWSKYKDLDFRYPVDLTGGSLAIFDNPVAKNWKNSNAYRIGLTQKVNDSLRLMAGFTIDKSPAPDSTLGFELPDSDSKIYSAGFEYDINSDLSIGFAYLYGVKEDRKVNNANMNGKIKDGRAHLASFAFKYRF